MMVHTDGLTRQFGSGAGVRGISLAVPEGSAFALVGANGSGKTTLLRLLVNILQPTAGSATVLGRDSRALTADDFQSIGYVSEAQKLPRRLTVDQLFDHLRPLYKRWDVALESRVRSSFGLPATKRLQDLSHGTRMKAMLASVLPFRPALLVLDEPLVGLDMAVRDEVLEGLIQGAVDTTIVIATNELAEIQGFATHLALLQDGDLLFQEELDTLAGRLRGVEVVLPGSQGLPAALPATWLAPQTGGRTFRFIDTAFAGEDVLADQLRGLGLSAERVQLRPLPLREFVIAQMRRRRQEPDA